MVLYITRFPLCFISQFPYKIKLTKISHLYYDYKRSTTASESTFGSAVAELSQNGGGNCGGGRPERVLERSCSGLRAPLSAFWTFSHTRSHSADASFQSATMVKGRQGERVRLYVRGTILGYKRSKSNQYPNTSLIQIEGVNTQEEVAWYLGKRMAYIYKAKVKKNGSHYRCIWGKVTRPHGNSGVVRAKFKSNLPPKSMGTRVRVMMYPSNI
ncbi:hypothetical protein SASPL_146163 [Salvia splendens]|uniref:Large subunit ribosomal protein L35Ae n=2 Tax=Salvia splendens TaxID=180675 RepID=A0A8X8Z8P8_SALSN|nr:hypothetical protein SASPL_146163 [Salvia splendens]